MTLTFLTSDLEYLSAMPTHMVNIMYQVSLKSLH